MSPVNFAIRLALSVIVAAGSALAADSTGEQLPWAPDPPASPAMAKAAAISKLGGQLFFDTGLSASGKMSCATCHDARSHFAPANALSVQLGGAQLDRLGTRATPSLTYAATTPSFTEHYYESEDDGNESIDQGPTGGRTWDGRIDRASDQAQIPLLSPLEMANTSQAQVVAHVKKSPYARELRRLYGDKVFADVPRAFHAIGEALEAFQQTPALFSPFTSKYDAFLQGQAQLSEQETRGLIAYMDSSKGNCVRCHKNQMTAGHKLPLFSDAGFVAIGLPRNRDIPANRDPNYYDLGACGPERKDLADRPEYCGLFKAPSLRNVATRQSFYHNGIFHSLREAVSFYATRDTHPERWYPVSADGTVLKFDDLPAAYHKNIDVEAPFDRQRGETPALSEQDIDDIVAYLNTLTDGYLLPATPPPLSAKSGPQ